MCVENMYYRPLKLCLKVVNRVWHMKTWGRAVHDLGDLARKDMSL